MDDKKGILKSNFFKELFLVPCVFIIVLSFIGLLDSSSQSIWSDLVDDIIFFIIFSISWFFISFFISLIHQKMAIKRMKRERKPKKSWEEVSVFIKIRFYLIMSIITFIIGILLSYDSIGFSLNAQTIILALAFFPCVLFIVFLFIVYKKRNNEKLTSILKIISVIITCFLWMYYFIALVFIVLIEATNPMTNPKYYKYHRPDKIFPKNIPENAQNVNFVYYPPILQGGMRHTLYYIDDNMTIYEFHKKYKNEAEWIGHLNDYKENRGLLDGVFSYTPSKYKNENDYIIYLIEGSCDDSGYCNHGSFLIAAFNNQTHEVVYSTETW